MSHGKTLLPGGLKANLRDPHSSSIIHSSSSIIIMPHSCSIIHPLFSSPIPPSIIPLVSSIFFHPASFFQPPFASWSPPGRIAEMTFTEVPRRHFLGTAMPNDPLSETFTETFPGRSPTFPEVPQRFPGGYPEVSRGSVHIHSIGSIGMCVSTVPIVLGRSRVPTPLVEIPSCLEHSEPR